MCTAGARMNENLKLRKYSRSSASLRTRCHLGTLWPALAAGVALMLAITPRANAQAILSVTPTATANTVAGTGTAGYSGNNGAATKATFAAPSAVAYDSKGDLFIADTNNNVVREVSPSGIVTTVAGNGQQGFSGDGGPATSAELNAPTGITIDSNGNLYIADSGNNRIREVSNGTITTVAGNGTAGYSGDGGPATSAELEMPSAVAVDSSGNLYIADTDNQRIRKVSGGKITTVAGNGEQGFSGDGGPATSATLDTPTGVAVDASGNIYIADSHNNRIREVSNGTITTVAGSGPVGLAAGFGGDGGSATAAKLADPSGVAINASGDIYIADTNNNRLREVGNGSISTVAGTGVQGYSGDGGAAATAELNTPQDVAVNTSGNAAVADSLNERVRGVNLPTLTYVSQAVGATSNPQYVTIANSGSGTLTVQSLNVTGGFATVSGGTCSALPIALAAGQSCTQAIVFVPTASGTSQGSLVVGGSGVVPQTVLLTGMATQSTPSISLTASTATVLLDNPVTLTAIVSSGTATPTGTVTFLDGTTTIGSAPLSAGTASISVSNLAAGTHGITAVYSGSASFTSVTSATITEQVENFSLNVASGSITSVSIAPGGSATYKLLISPAGAKTFPQGIQLSASGMPSGAVATFSPSSIKTGSGATTITLTIQVPNTTAALKVPNFRHNRTPLYLGVILLPFADIKRNRTNREKRAPQKRPRPWLKLMLMMACALVAFAGITGCGSNAGFFAHPSQNYTVTITGTAGALSHSTTVQLNVK